jgi:hypothetical protein
MIREELNVIDEFAYEKNEWDNCIHEYVAPKDFMRSEYKRPLKPAKEYKFKLDKF